MVMQRKNHGKNQRPTPEHWTKCAYFDEGTCKKSEGCQICCAEAAANETEERITVEAEAAGYDAGHNLAEIENGEAEARAYDEGRKAGKLEMWCNLGRSYREMLQILLADAHGDLKQVTENAVFLAFKQRHNHNKRLFDEAITNAEHKQQEKNNDGKQR